MDFSSCSCLSLSSCFSALSLSLSICLSLSTCLSTCLSCLASGSALFSSCGCESSCAKTGTEIPSSTANAVVLKIVINFICCCLHFVLFTDVLGSKLGQRTWWRTCKHAETRCGEIYVSSTALMATQTGNVILPVPCVFTCLA